jgi:V/A-type H+-transporting ATPase subunit K
MEKKDLKRRISLSLVILIVTLFVLGIPTATRIVAQTHESDTTAGTATAAVTTDMSQSKATVMAFGLVAAAIAFGFGALGAGIAIANVGAAAMGAIGEKPEMAGQALIFIALAEGLVVFGFITSLMILGKV